MGGRNAVCVDCGCFLMDGETKLCQRCSAREYRIAERARAQIVCYGITRHPWSGELYGVGYDADGEIVAAVGPLHHSDPQDDAAIADQICNAGCDAIDDGIWFAEELEKTLRR